MSTRKMKYRNDLQHFAFWALAILILSLGAVGCFNPEVVRQQPFDYKAACGQSDCGKEPQ